MANSSRDNPIIDATEVPEHGVDNSDNHDTDDNKEEDTIRVRVDDEKKSVILEGLNELTESAMSSTQEVTEMKIPARLIARITLAEDEIVGLGCRLHWVSTGENTLSRNERLALAYSNNLDSVAEYEDGQTLTAPMAIIFATFECIRVGLDRPFIYILRKDGEEYENVYI